MNEHFLTEIEIKQFKCFTDFKASGFKRVNLIGGKNNIGKTALMEACYIQVYSKCFDTLTSAIYGIYCMRKQHKRDGKSIDDISFYSALPEYATKSNLHNTEIEFYFGGVLKEKHEFKFKGIDLEEETSIETYLLKFDEKSKKIRRNELKFKSTPHVNFIGSLGSFNYEVIDFYAFVQELSKESELNGFIKEFDSSIDEFKVIKEKLKLKVNNKCLDLSEFGDGLKNYISIICALYACKDGYLFIDEIDNGIYYEHFDRLWGIILTLSKETNCQVFATTHSKEMLESFARVAKKLDEQDISYTLLVKNKQQELKTISFDYEMLEYSMSQEHEVR